MGQVVLEVNDGVAVITIDNALARNALTADMAVAMIEHCERIDLDPSVGAAVVQGAGGHFCSGAHRDVLKRIGRDPSGEDNYQTHGALYEAFHRFGQLSCPTIAAARGSAIGAGINLMLAADLRIVSADIRIQSGFLRIGVHPGGGHFSLVAHAAGAQAAAALGIFGEQLDGREAAELGLAWRCVEDDRVEEVALGLATRAAQDPALAREATASLRMTTRPPGVPWDVALWAERAPQMRALRAKHQTSPGSGHPALGAGDEG